MISESTSQRLTELIKELSHAIDEEVRVSMVANNFALTPANYLMNVNIVTLQMIKHLIDFQLESQEYAIKKLEEYRQQEQKEQQKGN